MEKKGFFITFEGIEGSGKTTQQRLLIEFLEKQNADCVWTREPGGTAIGVEIRKILLNKASIGMTSMCEALLYLADRAQHHREVVVPSLSRGAIVVSDRYHDSTRAYQGVARGLPVEELDRIFALVVGNLKPDLTFLLDLSPAAGLRRAQSRLELDDMDQAEGRFESETIAFHQAVRESFLRFAREEPDRFVVIDAEREPTEVADEIRRVVEKKFEFV